MNYDPVCVIVGSGRCGTTLVADQLREHPKIESIFELPSLNMWLRRLRMDSWPPTDADFAEDGANIELATHLDPGFNWRISGEEARCFQAQLRKQAVEEGGDLIAIRKWLRSYHMLQLKRSGREYLVHKTPGLSRFLPELRRVLPRARILHLVRHPCAVVASYLSVPWGTRDLDTAINWYVERVYAARRDGVELGDDFLEIRFEDLVIGPVSTFAQILAWLGIEMEGHRWSVEPRPERIDGWRQQIIHEDAMKILTQVRSKIPDLGY